MIQDITAGNTISDGKDFRFWIVGGIEKWCRDLNIPFDAEQYGLRNSSDIEIKWGIYKKDDVRPVWASCSHMTGMSILIRGNSTFYFRDTNDHSIRKEVRLTSEGDYVIWKEDVEHTWEIHEDSVFLTMRWPSHDTPMEKTY